ncbi:MAG: TonB-dependent receptor [Bacteroidota bacterium]
MSLKQKYYHTLALLSFFFLGSFSIYSQSTGQLNGLIVDSGNEPLIGAYVSLANTDHKTVSELDGSYRLENVPYGDYEIVITYVGMSEHREPISISTKTSTLDINLNEEAELLAEALVIGKTQAREQQERAIQIESVELKQVVSRVKDVGEVIERLPGVNVRGSGSFGDQVDISLNGLNGTAVRTFMDGLPLEFIFPQFTINNIPVNSIARVDVFKGVVPIDVGGDALGGGVNVITRQNSIDELQMSYNYGSFNTHQAALSGNYEIIEGVSVGGNFTYNYSDNNYTMEAFVFEENERREITRFNDAYELYYGDISLDVRNKAWTDRFRVTLNANDFYKEVQNGGIIGNTAFGEVFYDGGGFAASALYEKSLGDRLSLSTNSIFSRTNILFVDTTANVYSWSGEVLARRPNARGELSRSSISDRDFDNIANRLTLRWNLSLQDEIILSNLIARQSTIGRDTERPLERDPLTETQVLLKDVLGLQYQRKLFQDKLVLSAALKLYYFELSGVDPNALTPVGTDGTEFGYYATAKYNFTERFFVRASYEDALRIPTFTQFFGNGTNVRQNLILEPENSDNYNLGISFASPRSSNLRFLATANGFARFQQNLIFLNAATFPSNENADDVETLGVEGSLNIWFKDWIRLDANATRLRQVFGEVTSLSQAKSLEGTDFPNIPKWFYNARLTYTNDQLLGKDNNFSIYAQYKFVDRFNFLTVAGVLDDTNTVPQQERIDAGVNVSLKDGQYGVAFNINNILDADLFDNFSIPRPGRNFNVRVNYRFRNFNKGVGNK